MNRYELKAGGTCPANGRRDLFDVTVESERTIPVELIVEATIKLDAGAMFQ